jgi:hypothetical protein
MIVYLASIFIFFGGGNEPPNKGQSSKKEGTLPIQNILHNGIVDRYGICLSKSSILDESSSQKIFLNFYVNGSLSLEQSRDLIVDIVEQYVSHINKNDEILQYLDDYPFSKESLEVKLFVKKNKNNSFFSDQLQSVHFSNGKIKYKSLSGFTRAQMVVEEDYKKAEFDHDISNLISSIFKGKKRK